MRNTIGISRGMKKHIEGLQRRNLYEDFVYSIFHLSSYSLWYNVRCHCVQLLQSAVGNKICRLQRSGRDSFFNSSSFCFVYCCLCYTGPLFQAQSRCMIWLKLRRYVNEKVKWNIKNCLFLYEEFTVKSLIGRDTDYGAVNHIWYSLHHARKLI